MTGLLEIVSSLEEMGGKLMLDGDRIRYSIPKDSSRAQALLDTVRTEKRALVAYPSDISGRLKNMIIRVPIEMPNNPSSTFLTRLDLAGHFEMHFGDAIR